MICNSCIHFNEENFCWFGDKQKFFFYDYVVPNAEKCPGFKSITPDDFLNSLTRIQEKDIKRMKRMEREKSNGLKRS